MQAFHPMLTRCGHIPPSGVFVARPLSVCPVRLCNQVAWPRDTPQDMPLGHTMQRFKQYKKHVFHLQAAHSSTSFCEHLRTKFDQIHQRANSEDVTRLRTGTMAPVRTCSLGVSSESDLFLPLVDAASTSTNASGSRRLLTLRTGRTQ